MSKHRFITTTIPLMFSLVSAATFWMTNSRAETPIANDIPPPVALGQQTVELNEYRLLLTIKNEIDTGVDCRSAKAHVTATPTTSREYQNAQKAYLACFEAALYYDVHRLPFLAVGTNQRELASNARLFWQELAKYKSIYGELDEANALQDPQSTKDETLKVSH